MASVIVILSPLLKALSVLWFISWVGGWLWGLGSTPTSGWQWKCSDSDGSRQISRLSSRLKTPFTRTFTAGIPPIIPPPYLQKTTKKEGASSFSATGSLTLLWPYWARAGAARGAHSARSGSTLLNALTRDVRLFRFFPPLFCYIFMILLCCWVATAFKNNQSLYLFRKLDWFCE